jgi:hypothetical protein
VETTAGDNDAQEPTLEQRVRLLEVRQAATIAALAALTETTARLVDTLAPPDPDAGEWEERDPDNPLRHKRGST